MGYIYVLIILLLAPVSYNQGQQAKNISIIGKESGVESLVPKSKQVAIVEGKDSPSIKKVVARITYWTHDEANYKWGKKIAANPKRIATEGRTVAVDPKKIPYGAKVYIPKLEGIISDGIFVAEDTGSAVKAMDAIPKNRRNEVNYVIDVYVDSLKKMNYFSSKMPEYMDIYIMIGF